MNDKIKLATFLICMALAFIIAAVSLADGQTRGATALTISANQNLGYAEGQIGSLGTVETRHDRFGFAATGTFGQAKKNQGGSGFQGSGAGEVRYFVRDAFVSGGLYAGGYSVKQFSKRAMGVSVGAGVVKPTFTLSGQIDHDLSGVTRRNSLVGRFQAWAPTKGRIHPYFEVSSGIVRFNQNGSQTGFSFRAAGGVWLGEQSR